MPSPIFSELSPKETLFPGKLPLRGNVLSFCSRVFLSIYTPVVWIATLFSLKMVVSSTESVYIYSCYLDRLVSEMYDKSDVKVRIIAIFQFSPRLNKIYFCCNFRRLNTPVIWIGSS